MTNSKLRTTAAKIIPLPIRKFLVAIYATIKRMLTYKNYDSSEYWRKRATCPGQAAVLWNNQEYNELYRKDQAEILKPYIQSLQDGSKVLDIGCGIGVIASLVRSIRHDVSIDAVDFEEMITVAREQTKERNINYIASPAEDFTGCGYKYDLIISSACYSMIRDIDKLKKALKNGANMLSDNGIIVMIDPFHRWNYLARAKFNTKDVETFMKEHQLVLEKKSGILFWLFRDWLANSGFSGAKLEKRYRTGEKLLKILGQHFWADYKILIFRKA